MVNKFGNSTDDSSEVVLAAKRIEVLLMSQIEKLEMTLDMTMMMMVMLVMMVAMMIMMVVMMIMVIMIRIPRRI